MANITTGNPLFADTTGTLISIPGKSVRLIQWVDDNGDIVDDSTITLTINGVALVVKLQMEANINNNVVVWQIGPFNPGLWISSLVVTAMATGELHVWCD